MTQDTPIQAGDTVYLKSGSYAFTVVFVDASRACHVSWTTEHSPTVFRDCFPEICLTKNRPIHKKSLAQ